MWHMDESLVVQLPNQNFIHKSPVSVPIITRKGWWISFPETHRKSNFFGPGQE